LFTLLVVNARHIKAVPGRRTDVQDAAWIAAWLRYGLWRGSFMPAKPPRQVRELTRHRTALVQDRARVINRVQAVSEEANLTLAAVVTDIRGVPARAMLEALIAGHQAVTAPADLARGRLRTKRAPLEEASQGYCTPHHSVLLTEDFSQMADCGDARARGSGVIAQRLAAEHEAIALLDTIPGVSQRTAEVLLAESGTDMTRFPKAKHLAPRAGMCPGNDASGGKRLSGKPRKGSRWLRQVLADAAHVAAQTKPTYWAAPYQRMAARRGKKRALIAPGHTLSVIASTLVPRKPPYQDLGAASGDSLGQQRVERRFVQPLERLGYQVSLQPSDL
jgi:transposase